MSRMSTCETTPDARPGVEVTPDDIDRAAEVHRSAHSPHAHDRGARYRDRHRRHDRAQARVPPVQRFVQGPRRQPFHRNSADRIERHRGRVRRQSRRSRRVGGAAVRSRSTHLRADHGHAGQGGQAPPVRRGRARGRGRLRATRSLRAARISTSVTRHRSMRTTTRSSWRVPVRVPANWISSAPGLDAVLLACGGGGLSGGNAAWYGDRTETVAVETHGTATYAAARRAGKARRRRGVRRRRRRTRRHPHRCDAVPGAPSRRRH